MTYWRILQDKIPRALLVGQTMSTFGNRLYQMAIFWLIWRWSHSTALAGYSALIAGGASIFGSIAANLVVDRWDRLKLTRCIDSLRFMVSFILPFTAFLHFLSVGTVYMVIAMMAGLSAVFDPAYEALLPSLIEPDKLSGFMSLMDIPARIARIAGPGMAGFILTVMPIVDFFTIDAGTYAVSVISLWWVQRLGRETVHLPRDCAMKKVSHAVASKHRFLLGNIEQSLTTLQRDSVINRIVILDSLGNIMFPVFTLGAMVDSQEVLNAGAAGYGWLIAAYGVGGLIGNTLAGRSLSMTWRGFVAMSGWGGIGLSFVFMGFSHLLLFALASSMGAGACGAAAHVSRAILFVVRVPTQELGRLYTLRNMVTMIATAIGTALVGVLLQKYSVSLILEGAGLLLLLIYISVFVPIVRKKLI
ncbi:MFS transporter [Ferroacidibacillus organovorans]|nr:MFS transporter [Ferroacidibacillus organovorans]